MKFKKLLKVIKPNQPIKLISSNTTGCFIKKSEVFRLDNAYFNPLIQSLGEFKVLSLRHVNDELQIPDYQDYIEITLRGGNDND